MVNSFCTDVIDGVDHDVVNMGVGDGVDDLAAASFTANNVGAAKHPQMLRHHWLAGAGQIYEFVDGVRGGNVPKEFIPSVGKGIEEAVRGGGKAGYPYVGVKAVLIDGKAHDVDSDQLSFEQAGILAFRQVSETNSMLLEPIMKIEVRVPEEFIGGVVGDLNSRRGEIGEVETQGDLRVVRDTVPISEMFAYSSSLRGATQGRGSFAMELQEYREVPRNIAEKVMNGDQG